MQVDLPPKAAELVDLTETIAHGRPGGRFWALTESDDEEQVENQVSTSRLVVSQVTGSMESPELKAVPDRRR